MLRREVITLLGGAAAAWPPVARAQQPGKLPTIGFLGVSTPSAFGQWVAAFVQRLRELGWIEGRTVAIEYRWAEGHSERGTSRASPRKITALAASGPLVPSQLRQTATQNATCDRNYLGSAIISGAALRCGENKEPAGGRRPGGLLRAFRADPPILIVVLLGLELLPLLNCLMPGFERWCRPG